MFADRNQVVLPINLEIKIPENDPVFKLVEICDRLNYEKLEKEYLKKWRKINPATMFRVIGFSRNKVNRYIKKLRNFQGCC